MSGLKIAQIEGPQARSLHPGTAARAHTHTHPSTIKHQLTHTDQFIRAREKEVDREVCQRWSLCVGC